MTLDKEDINDLKNCQPGDCNIQMSDTAMQQLKAGKNVTELAKQMLVQYVDSYLKGGDLSLSVYHDRKYPTYLALEFESLLNNSKYIKEYAPEFDDYLRKFPNAQLNGVENFIYWEKAKFAKKPVISITHVCIYQPDDQRAIIASKQIYSSHYFTGILGLTGLIDATPQSGIFVVTINRARAASIAGSFGLRKQIVQNEMESAMEQSLNQTKRRIEKAK